MLQVEALSCGYGRDCVLESVSFSVGRGEMFCLLGPNGVGKTTFFKTLLGFLKPLGGAVYLNGQDIHTWSRKRFAQSIAYVPQAHSLPFPFSVLDVVVAGRNAHAGLTSMPKRKDYRHAYACMEELDILGLKDKVYTELSGGEQQMVLIARAVTQQPMVLVMDEPTSNLDYGNQVKIINLVHDLTCRGLSVVMTTHSPDHALLCDARVLFFQDGKQSQDGEASRVITADLLDSVYGVEANVCNAVTKNNRAVQICVPTIHYNS